MRNRYKAERPTERKRGRHRDKTRQDKAGHTHTPTQREIKLHRVRHKERGRGTKRVMETTRRGNWFVLHQEDTLNQIGKLLLVEPTKP